MGLMAPRLRLLCHQPLTWFTAGWVCDPMSLGVECGCCGSLSWEDAPVVASGSVLQAWCGDSWLAGVLLWQDHADVRGSSAQNKGWGSKMIIDLGFCEIHNSDHCRESLQCCVVDHPGELLLSVLWLSPGHTGPVSPWAPKARPLLCLFQCT